MNLKIWNKRMLLLMDFVIGNKVKGVDSQQKFNKIMKVSGNTAINQVRAGLQSFTHVQIHAVCSYFNIDMNWIYGFSEQMYRTGKDMSIQDLALELLVRVRK